MKLQNGEKAKGFEACHGSEPWHAWLGDATVPISSNLRAPPTPSKRPTKISSLFRPFSGKMGTEIKVKFEEIPPIIQESPSAKKEII